tara:strand:+ start:14396 stop:15070 length:675 start_codon:yes stop_codon:yes gene_type:complete
MYIPGFSYHIVQRGNNREACFLEKCDFQYYLMLLSELSARFGVDLHAFVLMTNHIHFLATPRAEDSISRMMRVVGSRYAQHFNRAHGRTGTLWEGRHKASAVDTQDYLLKCYRYIELNPVAAGMVERPEEYCWSSYGVNAWGESSELVRPHAVYTQLGGNSESRQHTYRDLFKAHLSDEDLLSFRQASHFCQPVGGERFRQQIEGKLGRSLGYMKRGRPKVVKS